MSEERSGDAIVLVLVVSLLLFLLVFWQVVTWNLDPEDRSTLWFPVLRLVNSAIVAVGILVGIGAFRKDRDGWFWYLVAALVPLVNVAVTVYWLAKGRQTARRLGRWTV